MSPRRLPFWAALIALPLGACQDYVFDQKCSESIKEQELTRPAARPLPADVLFVVDNSGSMADEQQKLADSFDRFINEIAGNGDYHIAVVTTDLSFNGAAGSEREGLTIYDFSDTAPYFGLIQGNTNDSQCADVPSIKHGCFRGPNPATRMIDSMAMPNPQDQINAFKANVLVGSCGSGTEEGLAAMVTALQRAGSGECNGGFLRPDANLVVVIVSDEEDQTPSTPVSQFVNDLIAVKGSATQVRVGVVVGSVDGEGARCSIGQGANCGSLCNGPPPDMGSQNTCSNPNPCNIPGEGCVAGQCVTEDRRSWDINPANCGWCSYFNAPDCCSALAGRRYVDFARQIEDRVRQEDSTVVDANCRGMPGQRVACLIDTICQDNFGETLARIAKDLVVTTDYALNPAATYAPGVRARVTGGRFGAGVELTPGEDFTVNDQGTSLHLTAGQKTPGAGETLDIYYVSERVMNNDMPRGACK